MSNLLISDLPDSSWSLRKPLRIKLKPFGIELLKFYLGRLFIPVRLTFGLSAASSSNVSPESPSSWEMAMRSSRFSKYFPFSAPPLSKYGLEYKNYLTSKVPSHDGKDKT